MRKKLDYDYCSASPILEWLGDKWALVVLLKPLGGTEGYIFLPTNPSVTNERKTVESIFSDNLEQLKQWGQENFETIMENRLKNKY